MKIHKLILFFFKNLFIFFVILFLIAISYGLSIQLLYVKPFTNICNTAKDYTPQEYINLLNDRLNSKHTNITNISPRFIEFNLYVPYIPFEDIYECTVWIEEKSQQIRKSEIENY